LPIQPENKIFPHIVPPLPERTKNLAEDLDNLYAWIADQQKSLDELNRQVVDKYNAHIDGTHAHPKAWAKWRLKRPGYYNDTAGGTTVTVSGSVGVPAMFVINGELFEITSDLTCDLSGAAGAGSIDTGAIAANTPYYLYGIKNSSTVALIASVTTPVTGPTGYTGAWTYLGACATTSSSATFRAFTSVDGFSLYDGNIETETISTPEDSYVSKAFASCPITAKKGWFRIHCDPDSAGVGAGFIAYISGDGNVSSVLSVCPVNGQNAYNYGWVNFHTAKTVHLYISDLSISATAGLKGWQEDPMEYK